MTRHQRPLPEALRSGAEIQEMWNIHPKTLSRRAAEGKITAYRFGRRIVRYDPQEVLDNLATTNEVGRD